MTGRISLLAGLPGPGRRFQIVLLIVIAAGFALRLFRLGDANVWWDEGYSVWVARQGLAEGALATAYDVHPPLYYWLLHCWRLVAGESEYALRFLSALLGILVLSLTFRVGRVLTSSSAAALSTVLVAVSRFSVTWSQGMRMYTLATALGLATTWLALRLWRQRPGDRWLSPALVAYWLAGAALLHTLYLGGLFLLMQNLLWVVRLGLGCRSGWRRWLAAQVLIGLSAVPWLAVFLPRVRSWSVAEPVGLGRFLHYYWGALVRGTSVHIERYQWHLVALGILFLAAAGTLLWDAVHRWQARESTLVDGDGIMVALAVLPPLLVYALAQPHGFFYSPRPEPRYLNPFAPMVYLVWGAGLIECWRRQRVLGAALALASVVGLSLSLPAYYRARYLEDDYRSLACTLRTYRQPGDLVLLHTDSDWPVFAYHYDGTWQGVPNDVAWDSASAAGFLSHLLPRRETIWLVLTTDAIRADPGMALERHLYHWCQASAGGSGCNRFEWWYGERRLVRLSSAHQLPEPSVGPALAQEPEGPLAGVWWPARRISSGSQWRLYLWWRGPGAEVPSLVLDGSQPGEAVTVQPVVEAHGTQGGVVRVAYELFFSEAGHYWARLAEGPVLTGLEVAGRHPLIPVTARGQAETMGAVFAEAIRLEGFAISAKEVFPGEELCVILHWRRQAGVDRPYAVFVHLLGETFNAEQGNFLWGQHDGQPSGGARPIPSWRPGEAIVDGHCFTVHPQAPPGPYLIEVGLYDRSSGQRLPVSAGGEGDRIILASVEVLSLARE